MTTETVKRIPCTIISGYLGSGKTSLLNHLLSTIKATSKKRVAVVLNEFAMEFGLNNELEGMKPDDPDSSVAHLEEVFEFGGGCLCCSSMALFLKAMQQLATSQIDHVLIETTGRADPGPIVQAFTINPIMKRQFYVDGLVTVVDAERVLKYLSDVKLDVKDNAASSSTAENKSSSDSKSSSKEDEDSYKNEVLAQLLYADRVLVNKTDLVSASQLQLVHETVGKINSFAKVMESKYSKVPVDFVLGIESSHHPGLKGIAQMSFKDHDPSIESVALTRDGEIDSLEDLLKKLHAIIEKRPDEFHRLKGALAVKGEKRKVVLQGVNNRINVHYHTEFSSSEERRCVLVFIGKNVADLPFEHKDLLGAENKVDSEPPGSQPEANSSAASSADGSAPMTDVSA